jgi:hypothetical protein
MAIGVCWVQPTELGRPSTRVHDAGAQVTVPLVQLGRCAGKAEAPVLFGAFKRRLVIGEFERQGDGRRRPALRALGWAHDAVAEFGW